MRRRKAKEPAQTTPIMPSRKAARLLSDTIAQKLSPEELAKARQLYATRDQSDVFTVSDQEKSRSVRRAMNFDIP